MESGRPLLTREATASCSSASSAAALAQAATTVASNDCGATTNDARQRTLRIATLDIARGLAVALMIFVDDAGDAVPAVNHAPWDGLTLADVVMPLFLFVVGASMALSLSTVAALDAAVRRRATRAVAGRALRLWALGVVLQGGGWLGDDEGARAVHRRRRTRRVSNGSACVRTQRHERHE